MHPRFDVLVSWQRFGVTAGLAGLAVAAWFVAPRLQAPTPAAAPTAAEQSAEAMGDWCVRVGKLECCVADEE